MRTFSLRAKCTGLVLSLFTMCFTSSAFAGDVAIVQGGFYTPNLASRLTIAGHNVTEIPNYTAASLAAFDAVIQDGNSFLDTNELRDYATAGGTVIFIPWTSNNFSVPADMQVMDNGSCADYSITYPGVTVLEPANPLLDGVTFPAAGGFDIGRVCTLNFVVDATEQIANWGDANSAFLGTRTVGAGKVIHLNMHLITSDTAYEVIYQDWATTLVNNFIDGGASVADGIGRFNVTKTFTDGSTDPVDVMLTCNSGLPLEQTFTIEGGDAAGVTFVVTDLPDTGATCTVTESGGPDGYTPILNGGAGCEWTGVAGGVYTCAIVNEADPATFTVNKVWEVNDENGGDDVDRLAVITITCDAEIQGGYQDDDDFSSDDGIPMPPGYGDWMLDETLIGDDSLVATVDTSMGPATCWAEETVLQSGVDSTDDCGPREIGAGETSECTITNTVFFEGIPSLNQYGLAIMALLMLGMGMVGFRRFV